jgi:SAM-dependent methyltransferase
MTRGATTTQGAPEISTHARVVATYYDRFTEPFYLAQWDSTDLHLGLFPPLGATVPLADATAAMTRRVLAPLGSVPLARVVDAGCGGGGTALAITREHGGHVLGLTVSGRQVELASERARCGGLADRAQFVQADCTQSWPVETGSVDAVVTVEAVCHFADRGAFLAEARRVLRPGGRLVGSDWMTRDGLSPYAAGLAGDMEASWYLAPMETRGSWTRRLEAGGFRVDAADDLGAAVGENARRMLRRAVAFDPADEMDPSRREQHAIEQRQLVSLALAWYAGAFTVVTFAATR